LAIAPRRLLRLAGGLTSARLLISAALIVVGLPLLTVLFSRLRDALSLAGVLLLYLLAVAIVAVIGGVGPAAVAVLAAVLLAAWFFAAPIHSLRVDRHADMIALLVFVVVAVTVSGLVDLGIRYRGSAMRSRQESALRRVATLVARGAVPQTVFDAVCEETGRLMGATTVNLAHFTPDDMNLTIAGWSLRGVHVPAGTRLPLAGETINSLVRRTGQPGRLQTYEDSPGPLAARLRELGIRSEVGAPVIVDGHVWGALIAGTDQPRPLPAGAEHRLARFSELIAVAVSNATTQAELIASRARIVTAADEARRRLAGDLHDGAQQQLVSAVINLQLADQQFDRDPAAARQYLGEALNRTRDSLTELRELAAGVHPSILTNRGLPAAVPALGQRSPIPVQVEVPDGRYPAHVEAAAYFVIAEALANVTKHAGASGAQVRVHPYDGTMEIDVRDDGVGGAHLGGHGLVGLKDRVEALGGRLTLDSGTGNGTHLHVALPTLS
jgi:signal transduction histidine kinase